MKHLMHYFRKKLFLGSKSQSIPYQGALLQADLFLKQLVEEGKVPGLAISVMKQGQLYFQGGYGFADLEKKIWVTPEETLFRIASASKPIAATALARMVGQGTIDLDASLYTYVPYFPKKEYDFSIRQLAAHTAGIRGYRGKEYALNHPYTIRESLVVFQEAPLLFRPGTDFLYNSFDWVLVSLAMEEASGIPFSDYVNNEVLNPLGMTNTMMEIPAKAIKNKAVCYSKHRSEFRLAAPVDNRYKLAGGGFLSTSEDLVKLGQAYLDQKIGPPAVIKEFLTAQLVQGRSTYYGLGWQVTQDTMGRPYFGHVGNGIGGYSNFLVYPEHQTTIAILMNCSDPRIQASLDEVLIPLFLMDAASM